MKHSTRNATIRQGAANLSRSPRLLFFVSLLASSPFYGSATGDSFFGFPTPRDDRLAFAPAKEPKDVSILARRVVKLYQEKRFKETVVMVEETLTELPDVAVNEAIREKLLSMRRLAKAKMIVATYRDQLKEIKEETLRRKMIAGLVITQTYGTVLQRESEERREATAGGSVFLGTTFFVRKESGLEITSENGEMIRSVDSSVFSFTGNRSVRVNEGSILLHLPKGSPPFRMDGPLAGVTIESDKASTALVSVTTSGGLKIIANERDLKASLAKGVEIKLRPGELAFALPEPQGFSRKMDVELSTILMTADLLTGFEEPVPFSRNLRLAATMQARRIKGRFRAVVGDVKTADEFEVKVIDKDDQEKEAEKSAKPEKKRGISRFFRGIRGRGPNK